MILVIKGLFILFIILTLSGCHSEESNFVKESTSPSSAALEQESSISQDIETSAPTELNQEDCSLKITIGEHTFYAAFADNPSAEEFRKLLAEGPVTITMEDYGGFEKVGPLGTTLTRTDTQITTEPGDVILYQGNQITIYYGVNSWNFTKLAKISDSSGLKDKLGTGIIEATFSLETQE